ncbi:MAG: tetratricopeptide repeat protein [Deltaproteobacteria bacterium]|nr:tetratricopeptide repeat protein [Deltaproteobacteria bacterium]
MDITAGEIIGNYRILKTNIAQGGNGIIHLAEDINNHNRKCALKVLNKDAALAHLRTKGSLPKTEEEVETLFRKKAAKFREEFHIAMGINHPNIAQMFDLGYHKGSFYIVSEFIEGKSLFQALISLPVPEKIGVLIGILEAIDCVHRHDLLHLDIKPQNILMTTNNGKPCPKLIDFGAALSIGIFNFKPRGTPSFIAPEVALSQTEKIDARADLFEFAATAYYCITSVFPFKQRKQCKGNMEKLAELIRQETPPPPLTDYDESIPEFLNTIILRLLAKDPEDRFYPHARAVINALRTQLPDAFSTTSRAPSSYLIPERDRHIGRAGIQDTLKAYMDGLSQCKTAKTPVVCIGGETGMGKTHLLKTLKEYATHVLEKITLHHLELPASEEWLTRWSEKIHRDFVSGEKPVLILIDNLDLALQNLADHLQIYGILSATGRLLREGALKKPVLLFFTSTKYPCDAVPVEAEHFRSFELKPFSIDELREYLASTPAFSNSTIPERWLKSFYSKTLGVPLEVRAALEELDAGGELLVFDPSGKILFSEWEEPNLEGSLIYHGGTQPTQERLLSQFSKLTKTEQDVICWMAVWNTLGLSPPPRFEEFSRFFPALTLGQTLLNLVDTRWLTHHEKLQSFEFVNPLAPMIIYETLEEKKRQLLHDALATHFADKNKTLASLHFGFGTDKCKAIYHLIHLGRLKMNQGQLLIARQLLNKALELSPKELPKLKIYILNLLIANYHNRGKYKEAEHCFESALKLIEKNLSNGTRLWQIILYEKMSAVLLEKGKREEALKLIQKGLALYRGRNIAPHFIFLKNHEGFFHYLESCEGKEKTKEHLEKAKAIFRKSLELEKNLQGEFSGVRRNNELGRVLKAGGRYAEAATVLLDKIETIKGDEKNIYALVETYLTLAECQRYLKNYEAAGKYAEEALVLAKKTGQGKWLMKAHMAKAEIYHDSDKPELALEEDKSSLVASSFLNREEEYASTMKGLMIRQGLYLKELKQWDEAVVHFDSALATNLSGMLLVLAKISLGEIYFHKKEHEKVAKHFVDAEAILKNIPPDAARPYLFRIAMVKAQMMQDQGHREKAIALLPTLKQLAAQDPQLLKECSLLEKGIR